jgi:hypothetical protein
MAVGLAFLKKEDGRWLGDYWLLGRGQFGLIIDVLAESSERHPYEVIPAFMYDEFEIEVGEKRPYIAKVKPSLANDFERYQREQARCLIPAIDHLLESGNPYLGYVENNLRKLKDKLQNGFLVLISY